MKTSLSLHALFAGCLAIAACSQATEVSRLQYIPNVGIPHRGAGPLSYAVLHRFLRAPDGRFPEANLVDVNGTLYGTTTEGGGYNNGTVFSITKGGPEKVLYSFANGADSAFPAAGLVDINGTLFGTTVGGGAYNDGTVFSITTGGAESVLYSFAGGSDGKIPVASLININGTLYGTTSQGGAYNGGTVFSITTGGTENVLHSFGKGADGRSPYAPLLDVSGTLYGTTDDGGSGCGSQGCGTVFRITTGGEEKVLHNFGIRYDGNHPVAGLVDANGTLYGTTEFDDSTCGPDQCGTVFSITPAGREKVLHFFFGGGTDGAHPCAGLVDVKGTLYGTTSTGGTYGSGTVFSITKHGAENLLHNFGSATDGSNPLASLTYVDGTLYGTTRGGGRPHRHMGTVFAITP
jgi:uncharacterized repeat protein (TIGR03803 family)